MNDRQQAIHNLMKVLETARNLRPQAFETAADQNRDVKLRWTAYDEIYELVIEQLERDGLPLHVPDLSQLGLTEKQIEYHTERTKRAFVGFFMLSMAYGDPKGNLAMIMRQLEEIVPHQPDPETWRLPLAHKDSNSLFDEINAAREFVGEDFACFYKGHSEPVHKRKTALKNIYDIVGPKWCASSDYAKTLTPRQRQYFVVIGLMSFVPKDQWSEDDIRKLVADLLPVKEPDRGGSPEP